MLSILTVESNVVAGVLTLVVCGIAGYGWRKWRGTTLAAPYIWVMISAASLGLLACAEIRGEESLRMSVARFIAAASTLTPVIAVLGAKRPQDRGWQWIVLSLWVIVSWPALQAMANPAGPRLELFMPWKLFIVALIIVGMLNYVPTRNSLANVFVITGQCILFSGFLGLPQPNGGLLLAVVFFITAAIFIAILRTASPLKSMFMPEHTERWLQFRDAFGAFWGLRILQRVNETAGLRNWPVRLEWTGFEQVEDAEEITPAQQAEIEQTLDTLLRRFL
jgi:hypothetical protein